MVIEGDAYDLSSTRALQRTAAALSVCESQMIGRSPLRSTGALRRLSLSWSLGGLERLVKSTVK